MPTPEARAKRAAQNILLVEDDPQMSSLLRLVLSEVGYAPMVAANGTEAGSALRRKDKLSLAIIDYKLPDMPGTHLAELIEILFPEARILFISGVMPASKLRPHWTLLNKPFRASTFISTVADLLNPESVESAGAAE